MSKPDFSGRWHFDPDASVLQTGRPDAVVFTLHHQEPSFRLERTFTLAGRSDSFSIDLVVGAENPPIPRGDVTLFPSVNWEGDELVFLTTIRRGVEDATNLVRYRLEADGTILVAEEHFRSRTVNYDNRWVFSKT